MPSAGATEKVPPLQIVVAIAAMAAAGFIVIVTVKFVPVQLPVNGVIV